MTNWMNAFFPTYQLAVSPGTDGSIRSGVISRYPITRSQSWLDGASLTNFGYNGTYTRDLFEAEITVPGATEPLHVHFASEIGGGHGQSATARGGVQRGLQLLRHDLHFHQWFSAVSAHGDLNEDINIPMSQNLQAIQRLVSAPTGLQLTTPLNPFTLTRFTFHPRRSGCAV